MIGFVVESEVDFNGVRGTARVWVATEARAAEIAGLAPGRAYRAVAYADMPPAVRESLEKKQS